MSVYLTKDFARFARKAGVPEAKLVQAARDIAEGRPDADLGGGVFKQRVPRDGGGKSGGFRTIVVFRAGHHVFFVHGFAKNAKANVSARELLALRTLAGVLLGFTAEQLKTAIAVGELIEIGNDENEEGW